MDPIAVTTIFGAFFSIVMGVLVNWLFEKFTILKSSRDNRKVTLKIGDKEFSVSGSRSQEDLTRTISEAIYEFQKIPQVFISYSKDDTDFVLRLTKDLRENGIKLWIADEQIRVGEQISTSLQKGITESQWIIFIISENLVKSQWINKELQLALKEEASRQKPFILPIVISGETVPDQLNDRAFADFRNNYELGLKKILRAIKPPERSSQITNGD